MQQDATTNNELEQKETPAANTPEAGPAQGEQLITTTAAGLGEIIASAINTVAKAQAEQVTDAQPDDKRTDGTPTSAEIVSIGSVSFTDQAEKAEESQVTISAAVEAAISSIEQNTNAVVSAAVEKFEQATGEMQSLLTELASQVPPTAEATVPEPSVPTQSEETVQPAKTEIIQTEIAAKAEKAELATAKHLATITKINALASIFLTVLLFAGLLIFAVLFFTERSLHAKQADENDKIIRALAQDLINSQLVKNYAIEGEIQSKIDSLVKEGVPQGQAISQAYLDSKVIKAVIDDLPPSVRNLPFAEETVRSELKKISNFVEKEFYKIH